MNRYRQLTSEERHTLSTLRKQGYQQAAIARALGRQKYDQSRGATHSKDRGAGSIVLTWPTTTLDGDAADRAAMSASVHRTGEWWRRASGNSGAEPVNDNGTLYGIN